MGPELADPPTKWVPNARVERIPGANHRVQMHRPERVTELLKAFLTGGADKAPTVAPAS
jgi:pimeloyl-ACP methyl ester carboxylesterase